MLNYFYIFGSLSIISAISFLGIFFLYFSAKKSSQILILLVSLSAGTLIGGAFLHLLPEAIEEKEGMTIWLLAIVGILIFFILEKIICWRHCHVLTSENHPHSLGAMNLIGDGLHNAIDGMIIAGAFMINIPLGIASAIAIIAHEVPQEIADFGVLVHAGYSRKKALIYNFLFSLSSFAGALLIIIIGFKFEDISYIILPIAAGGFIYIATADLIPELKKDTNFKKSSLQLLSLIFGIAIMAGLKYFFE